MSPHIQEVSQFFELLERGSAMHTCAPLSRRKQLQRLHYATIFKSLGMVVEHVAAALLVYRSAKNNRKRKELETIPTGTINEDLSVRGI